MNYTDPFRARVRAAPEAPALMRRLRDGSGVALDSYRDLDRTIDALAGRLAAHGVARGGTCTVSVDGHWATLVVLLTLGRMGVVASIDDDGGTDWTLVGSSASGTPERGWRIVVPPEWTDAPSPDEVVEPVPSAQDPDAVALIVRSSGTTGRPKRVPITHAQMLARVARVRAGNPMPAEGRLACPMGPSGGYGMRHMICALAGGSSILMTAGAERTLAGAERFGVTHLVVSPAILDQMVRARASATGPLPKMLELEVGGSRLPAALRDAAARVICANIHLSYGSSEVGVVARGSAAELAGIPDAVGRVFDDLDVQAVDEYGHPLPAGSEGLLRMRGEGCVDRYLGAPKASARAFRDGWFYPGDIGCVTADRVLVIRGRERELINAGGVKIAPSVLEDALAGTPGVTEIAAFGVVDAMGIERPWLAVVPTRDFDFKAFEAACIARLGVKTPAGVLLFRELPRNPNGKIVRAELAAIALERARHPKTNA